MLHILHGQLEHAQIFEEGRNYEFPLLQTLIGKDEAYLETWQERLVLVIIAGFYLQNQTFVLQVLV